MKKVEVGQVYESKSYGKFEVVLVENYYNIVIRFLDTGYVRTARKDHVLAGNVKDLMSPNVFSTGFLGVGEYKAWENGRDTPAYLCWRSMLGRCYSDKVQKRQPTYVGCSVCETWHNFQTFAKWYYENYPDTDEVMFLDKDTLFEGNKLYAPDRCRFVTRQENNAHGRAKTYVLLSPNGDVIKVTNLKQYAEKNGLSYKALHHVVSGKSKSHKGWKNAKCKP